MRRCALALLLLAAVAGESAAAPRARGGLPPGLAETAASLERHAPGALLRLPLDGGDRPLGAMAGPDGARAVLRYRGEREARGPRTTALTLPPGGVHFAPAATWSWASGERGSLEIEVYRGDLAAFRVVTWSRYDRWLAEVLGARRTRQIARYPRVAPDHRAALSAMAVRLALTSGPERLPPPWRPLGSYGDVRVWELPEAQGWAFFAREAVGVRSAEEAFARSRGDRPADALVPVEDERLPAGARAGGRARVIQVAREDARVRVWVTALEDSWLVVSQTAIPGWRASIDGRPVPLGRAYGVLAALPVPAGARLVELRYRPWGWLVGAPLSGATALLLVAALGVRALRRRSGGGMAHA